MNDREAMKLALEALRQNRRNHYYCEDQWYSCPKHEDGCFNEAEGDECNCGADKANQEIDFAITALRQALEQPDMGIDRGAWSDVPDATKWVDELRGEDDELPPSQKSLTEALFQAQNAAIDLAKQVENLSITDAEPVYANKNTIRWMLSRGNPSANVTAILRKSASEECSLPLYTAPPKREWVGLTDEEIDEYAEQSWVSKSAFESVAWFVERKLRDKNGF